MKKSLVLAMAMALGVTASAYAANPFSDVPAGHWAYDSIDKLAAAGVIDGMGDGTFQGDKTMTRYEMAQIVAKAMAKGANVDKLAAEFADELDNLGVRVANLEKKADNVKITGNIQMIAKSYHGGKGNTNSDTNHAYKLRSDLTISGQINEDWKYTALIRNDQNLDNGDAGKGEENAIDFQRAYVDGRVGGLKVRAGRHSLSIADGDVYSDRVDGIEVAYGKAIKLTAGYAQLSNKGGDYAKTLGEDNPTIAYAKVDTKVAKAVDLGVAYYKVNEVTKTKKTVANDDQFGLLVVGAGMNLSKALKVKGQYIHADGRKEEGSKNGWTAKLSYKGASAAKPGSFGLFAKYVDLPAATTLGEGGDATIAKIPGTTVEGYKGWEYGADYALAKNIVAKVVYFDLEAKNNADKKTSTLYTGVNFMF